MKNSKISISKASASNCNAFISDKCDCINGICFNFREANEKISYTDAHPMSVALLAYDKTKQKKA